MQTHCIIIQFVNSFLDFFVPFLSPVLPTGLRRKIQNYRFENFDIIESGSYLVSHTVASAVPSAYKSLTSVFGMGTGVSS